jgi:hypothetical protein
MAAKFDAPDVHFPHASLSAYRPRRRRHKSVSAKKGCPKKSAGVLGERVVEDNRTGQANDGFGLRERGVDSRTGWDGVGGKESGFKTH